MNAAGTRRAIAWVSSNKSVALAGLPQKWVGHLRILTRQTCPHGCSQRARRQDIAIPVLNGVGGSSIANPVGVAVDRGRIVGEVGIGGGLRDAEQ